MSLTYKVSGRGEKGGPAGAMLIFTVSLELDGKPLPDPKKEDLQVIIECPGEAPRTNVMGGSGGSYHVGFKPTEAGQYWLDFCWRGTWAADTYMMPIKDKAGKVPDHGYTGSHRGGANPATPATPAKPAETPAKTAATPAKTAATPTKTTAAPVKEAPKEPSAAKCKAEGPGLSGINDLEEGKFTITAFDAKGEQLKTGGHKFEVKIEGDISSNIVDNNNGTYDVKFGPVDAGSYAIHITYNGTDISGSPHNLDVEEEIIGGILSELDVLFILRGKDGETISETGAMDHIKVETVGSSDAANLSEPDPGVYSLNYQTNPGKNYIDVSIGGKSIEGFPLEFNL